MLPREVMYGAFEGVQKRLCNLNLGFQKKRWCVDLWRWCPWLSEQVWRVVGAGVEKGLRPAPLERADARFAEQVSMEKPHLRHGVVRPAPCGPQLTRRKNPTVFSERSDTGGLGGTPTSE
jgi:hypothetical protein